MKYILDPDKLYLELHHRNDEQRGNYILKSCIALLQGVPLSWATKQPKERSKEAVGEYSAEFETFWAEYPKKVGKQGAYIVWKKIKNPLLISLCMSALKWQKESQQWKSDQGKYIPNPETYLSKAKYEDERPVGALAGSGEKYLDINGCWREKC